MLKQLQKAKDQKGFTIIEVLIVLAIAGLIMVVVFLAVPNLQRSQRNNARKSDANNLLQNLSEYIGNANGSLPSACTGLTDCSWVSYKPAQFDTVSYTTTVPSSAPDKSTAVMIGKAKCSGVNAVASTNARDYVIWYGIEGSTSTVCTPGS